MNEFYLLVFDLMHIKENICVENMLKHLKLECVLEINRTKHLPIRIVLTIKHKNLTIIMKKTYSINPNNKNVFFS